MTVGTIGTGKMASTLASLWSTQGHAVMLGSRKPAEARATLGSLGVRVQVGTVVDAVAFGNVVLLATPWAAAESSIRSAGSFKGKILIDCTNRLVNRGGDRSLDQTSKTSAAEEVAQWADGARVVKAFNCIYWENLRNPRFSHQRMSCFFCGDDNEAKKTVASLIQDTGFEPVDSGPLSSARYLEPLALLWMQLAFERGLGKDIALTMIRR